MEWLLLLIGLYIFGLVIGKEDEWHEKKKPVSKRTKFSRTRVKKPAKPKKKKSLLYSDYWDEREYREVKAKYMRTKKYQDKRKARLKLDNYICQVCLINGTVKEEPLYVHHHRYDVLGKEDVEHDLLSLCKTHHSLQHDTYGYDYDTVFLPVVYE